MAEALGSRYWRLWTASTASNLADGVVRVGLPLVAVQLTRSPTLVAGVTVALTAPWLVGTLPAGAFADRTDRRRLLIGAAVLRASVLALIGVTAASGELVLVWVYVPAVALGAAETVFDTTSQSIIPDLVGDEHLDRANSRLYAAQVVMNEFAGAPLAGALVGVSVAAAPSSATGCSSPPSPSAAFPDRSPPAGSKLASAAFRCSRSVSPVISRSSVRRL